jgi:hypothetical protein
MLNLYPPTSGQYADGLAIAARVLKLATRSLAPLVLPAARGIVRQLVNGRGA